MESSSACREYTQAQDVAERLNKIEQAYAELHAYVRELQHDTRVRASRERSGDRSGERSDNRSGERGEAHSREYYQEQSADQAFVSRTPHIDIEELVDDEFDDDVTFSAAAASCGEGGLELPSSTASYEKLQLPHELPSFSAASMTDNARCASYPASTSIAAPAAAPAAPAAPATSIAASSSATPSVDSFAHASIAPSDAPSVRYPYVGSAAIAQNATFAPQLVPNSVVHNRNESSPSVRAAPLVSFVSGRGGMGKTALSACIAALAAKAGYRVALLDFDLACGNVSLCFGAEQAPDISRVLDFTHAQEGSHTNVSEEALAKAALCISDNLYIWGPCERAEMQELVSPYVGLVMSYARKHFDLVLVDTSTTFSDAVAQAVQASDRVMIVHDDLPDALHGLAKTSALAVRLGVARGRICRIENFSNPHARFDLDFGRNEVGLEGAESYKVIDGGMNVHELLATGHALELVDAKTPFVLSLIHISEPTRPY